MLQNTQSPRTNLEISEYDVSIWTIQLIGVYLQNAKTTLSGDDLQALVRQTFATLTSLNHQDVGNGPDRKPIRVPTSDEIQKSIGADALISFENGRRYKYLTRHLFALGMTPDQYRRKWNLPPDYPMVCSACSAQRSEHAKAIGLGVKGHATRDPSLVTAKIPTSAPPDPLTDQ